ncbi:MAG TPA: tetratricopeptide repeat protein [Bacteroidia bacterium]|nr:tetratricopeptide repeat protein [Bacteroidia bacterium]
MITAQSDKNNVLTTSLFRLCFSFFKSNFLIVLLLLLFVFSCKSPKETADGGAGKNKEGGLSDKDLILFKRLFIDANKERILGNYDMAEVLFSQALKIDPNSAPTMYELANIYSFQNNKTQALFYSKKAAMLDPKNVWYQLLYASCLKENKMPNEVAVVYEKLIKDNPENYDFYYELANIYIYLNKSNDAIKTYNKIEEAIGVTEESSMQKLKLYKVNNNFEKAVEEAKKLIKTFPKEAKYYGILGELYQEKGMNEKAFEAYNELIKIDSTNAYVHLSLADYYRNLKQNDKAFQEIKLAFKSTQLDIDTKVKILLSYYDITESFPELKSDADELCKIIVEVHPDEAKAYAVYGDFLSRDKKLELARTQFRKVLSLDKSMYVFWNQLLIIESELNDFVALQKESKEAMELFPNQPLPYYLNGQSNYQLRNYTEALASWTEGKEFVFDNNLFLADFYSGIGDAQNQLKNNDASDAAYDKSLELNPENAGVLNNYSYFLSIRNKNLEKAEAMSKKCNALQPDISSYQDTYGWILYQMKKYDDAKVWIGKAIDNGGKTNGTLLEHYGDVLYQLGDVEEAIKYWKDAKNNGGNSILLDKKIADKKLYE